MSKLYPINGRLFNTYNGWHVSDLVNGTHLWWEIGLYLTNQPVEGGSTHTGVTMQPFPIAPTSIQVTPPNITGYDLYGTPVEQGGAEILLTFDYITAEALAYLTNFYYAQSNTTPSGNINTFFFNNQPSGVNTTSNIWIYLTVPAEPNLWSFSVSNVPYPSYPDAAWTMVQCKMERPKSDSIYTGPGVFGLHTKCTIHFINVTMIYPVTSST